MVLSLLLAQPSLTPFFCRGFCPDIPKLLRWSLTQQQLCLWASWLSHCSGLVSPEGEGRGHPWVHDLNSRLPALNLGKTLTPGATLELCLPWRGGCKDEQILPTYYRSSKELWHPPQEGRCPAVFTVLFWVGGTSHSTAPSLELGCCYQSQGTFPVLCSFLHYLFHHFHSIPYCKAFLYWDSAPKRFLNLLLSELLKDV